MTLTLGQRLTEQHRYPTRLGAVFQGVLSDSSM
jgi:hypothetical protein